MMENKRVVVTGMGVISPLGLDAPIAGQSGIAPITLFDAGDMQVRIAGEAWGFDPTDVSSQKFGGRNQVFAAAL
ncbi:MAG: hypothetical protein U9R15_05935 [Chloroflexota bacterium]|nr:hypothetical protein [Chloroflexota bacterium]